MKQDRLEIPCATVEQWLRSHEITKYPNGTALGLSRMEVLTGLTANEGLGFVQSIRRQQSYDIAMVRRKKKLVK